MRPLLILLFLFCFAGAEAQNLIPNPGFEEECESTDFSTTFFGAPGWYRPTLGTVDFWTIGETAPSCYLVAINTEVWEGYGEYVIPIEGERMIGCYTWHESFCLREVLQCRLLEDLQAGETYCFSMWVQRSNMYNYANDGMGMALSTDSINDPQSSCGLDITPLVESQPGMAITDTLNWTRIEGSFVAEGGERYLTIGNLRNDEEVTSAFMEGTVGTPSAYYYIDDLSLTSCGVNVNEAFSQKEFRLAPNPASDEVFINGAMTQSLWKVYSLDGKERLQGSGARIDLSRLEQGIYIVQIEGRTLRLVCTR